MASREEWQRRLGPLYGGAVALVHSTPWRWPDELRREPEARSSAWVVAVGVPIGLVAWLAASVMRGVGVPAPIGALVGLAMLAVASAAIVERGVVDRVDQWQRTMHGPVAMLALVFTALIRAASIVYVAPAHWLAVFVAVAVVGRWAAAFLQALGDPITVAPDGRSLVATPAPLWLTGAISLGVLALAIVALGAKPGVLAIALVALVAFGLGVDAQRREGGLSAPVVALVAALGELLVLLVASAQGGGA